MSWPEFALRNVPEVLDFSNEAEESALGLRRGDAGTNPPQSPAGSDARITEWARRSGRCFEKSEFAETLDGRQVDRELSDIFRETPEFGRSLAMRVADFHETDSEGDLTLIGGGGEAVVFGDPENQQVIKLLGGNSRAGFGWAVDYDSENSWILRSGKLAESLIRFWTAEIHFPTGMDIHGIGEDGEFLLLSQPFIVGENPTEAELAEWMSDRGWERVVPPAELVMLNTQTWWPKEGRGVAATDVRCENAIRAEVDGEIYPFDYVMAPWVP